MIDAERSHCFATMRWYSQQWTAPYDAGQPTSDSHPEVCVIFACVWALDGVSKWKNNDLCLSTCPKP